MAIRLIDSRSFAHRPCPRTSCTSVAVSSAGALFRMLAGMLLGFTVSAPRAFATTAGAPMPWDGPLNSLVTNLTGPTARALVIIAVVACGLLWAFTRNEEGLKKLGQIAFGGAIALGAVTLMASLGIAGAVV